MLNVPEEIKTLFKADSIRKKLIIHFPNGEREDITNSNIIAESFSFTESICSQDTLKFGLCEASMVEFETFNIGNIKGCTIEITLEVLNGSEWYPIPIGTYVVDSCEKQSNMTRRSVKAYSNTRTMLNGENIVENQKRILPTSENIDYSFDMYKYLISNRKNIYTDMIYLFKISDIEYETKVVDTDIWWGSGDGSYHYRVNADVVTVEKDSELFSSLINVKCKQTSEFEHYKEIINKSDRHDIHINPHIFLNSYYFVKQSNGNYIMSEEGGSSLFDFDTNYLIYPYYSGLKDESSKIEYDTPFMQIIIPTSVVVYDDTSGEEIIIHEYNFVENCSFQRCDISGDFFSLTFSIPRKKKKLYPWNNTMAYLVDKVPDMSKPLEALLELNALFGKASRYGGFDFFKINTNFGLYPSETLYPSDNLYPAGTDILLTKSMYKSAWYDDLYTPLYSKVTCTYKDSETQEDTYAEHIIIEVEEGKEDKYQTYDISDNYLIKENTFTEAQIAEILANIASNIDRIRYMPAEVDLKGLPYLEAGDVVQVLTTDGGFETIILRRTLTGIQALSDNFESRG